MKNYAIRKITKEDEALFLGFLKEFYHSEAVLHPTDSTLHKNTFTELCRSDEYLEGYFISFSEKEVGYILLSKSFSPEVGGKIIWIEQFYVLPEFRSSGLGKELFDFIKNETDKKRIRLEIEPDNLRALQFYERLGFTRLGYDQLVLDFE